MDLRGSVARDMYHAFRAGTELQLFIQNGHNIIKLAGRDDLVLLYDPETGIMRDINTVNGFCGAYCFHDQITESSYDFFGGVKNSTSDYRDWAQKSVVDFSDDKIIIKFDYKRYLLNVEVGFAVGCAIVTGPLGVASLGVTTALMVLRGEITLDWDYYWHPWLEISYNGDVIYVTR